MLDEAGIKMKDLSSKSLAELKELKEKVLEVCNGGMGSGLLAGGVLVACGTAEHKCPKRLMDLTGYRAAVEANPQFGAICEQIEIDNGFRLKMTPVQQLTLCLGSTALQINAQNKARERSLQVAADVRQRLIAQRDALLGKPPAPVIPEPTPVAPPAPAVQTPLPPPQNADPYTRVPVHFR